MIHCCHWCLQCETEDCLKTYPDCEEFMASAFENCDIEEGPPWVTIIMVVSVCVGVCGIGVALYCYCSKRPIAQFAEMQKERERLAGSKSSEIPPRLVFQGSFTEAGITGHTQMAIDISKDGTFSGQGQDDDGPSKVKGVMVHDVSIGGNIQRHTICWNEIQRHTRTQQLVEMEAQGQLTTRLGSNVTTFEITADYVTRDGTAGGHVQLCSQQHTVVPGTMIGNPARNEGSESNPVMLVQATPVTQPERPQQCVQGIAVPLQNHAAGLQAEGTGASGSTCASDVVPFIQNPPNRIQNHAYGQVSAISSRI